MSTTGSSFMIQLPVDLLSLIKSDNNGLDSFLLLEVLQKLANKKSYSRASKRRRSTPRRNFPGLTFRPLKWQSVYSKARRISSAGNSPNGRQPRNVTSRTRSLPNSPRPSLSSMKPYTHRATSSTSVLYGERRSVSRNEHQSTLSPGTSYDLLNDNSDSHVTNDTSMLSSIENSPLYERQTRRRITDSHQSSHASSSSGDSLSYPQLLDGTDGSVCRALFTTASSISGAVSYPKLPNETSVGVEFELYHDKPLDDTTIDENLIDKLRDGPTGEVNNTLEARVYTFRHQVDKRYVKIGWSKGSLDTRKKGISPGGKNGNILNEVDTTTGAQSRFFNCFLAEQIIHEELRNYRYKMNPSKQTEWFQLSEDKAKVIVNKWRQWLIGEPYDENGQLKDFWRVRIQQNAARDAYNAAKHKSLHDRWNKILNPSWWDRKVYEFTIWWAIICMWGRWSRDHKPFFIVSPTGVFLLYSFGGLLPAALALIATWVYVLLTWPEPPKETSDDARKRRKSRRSSPTATP